ncbi:MAG: hypothetical protein LKJ88_00150 [Bacilli bacterium]|jgi:hypothetical protein|nr:hypothetical protein [Bacilli bacterium]
MNYKKRFAADVEKKLDAQAPHLDEFEKKEETETEKPSHKKLFWSLTGSLVGAALVLGTLLGIFQPWNKKTGENLGNLLTSPSERDIQKLSYSDDINVVSLKTINIYKSFVSSFGPEVFQEEDTSSKSFSVLDAFVNVCMLAYTSSAEIRDVILSWLGNPSIEEVNTAVKELINALGTPYLPSNEILTAPEGGFSLNSIWLDEQLNLKENSKEYLTVLEDYYYAAVYHSKPSAEKLNQWMKDHVPSSYPKIPQIVFPDKAKADINASVLSSYFFFRSFEKATADIYLSEYQSGNHYLDYSLADGQIKKADYTLQHLKGTRKKIIGSAFEGVKAEMGMAYFLPKEGKLPNQIMADVINENYSFSSEEYTASLTAPYFLIDNKLDLTPVLRKKGLTMEDGFLANLVGFGEQLAEMKQFSLLQYDYSGLYSASITIANEETTSVPQNEKYDLVLNRPYALSVSLNVKTEEKVGNVHKNVSLPVIFGEVFDPGYEIYKG